MGKVRNSSYRLDSRPCAQIHDAQYYVIRDDMEILLYMNKHLVDAVKWQEDPLITHPDVKLGGELSVFYPSWVNEVSLPNDAPEDVLHTKLKDHFLKMKQEGYI